MKNEIKESDVILCMIAMFLCGIVFALLLSSCSLFPSHLSTAIVTMRDVSQVELAQPKAGDIVRFYGFDSDLSNGGTFTYRNVNDVSQNSRTVFSLAEGGNSLTTNQFTRKREVEKYEQSIFSFIDSASHDTIGRTRSSIYIPLAQELNLLAENKSDSRILFLFSDLLENDNDLSFYNKQTLALIRSDPEKIKAALLAKQPLENLSGVTVYIIYQPENAKDDDTFRLMSNFYKSFLEQYNATVIIAANLTH